MRARRATSKFLNSPNSSPYKQLQKSDVKEDSVLERAQKSSSKKPISKITPESKLEKKNASMLKKEYKPSFHMSQTQGVEAVLPPYKRCSPRQDGGPLTGLSKSVVFNFFNTFYSASQMSCNSLLQIFSTPASSVALQSQTELQDWGAN